MDKARTLFLRVRAKRRRQRIARPPARESPGSPTMASMTAAVAGVTTAASARVGVRTQWPACSPAQARPRVGRSRGGARHSRRQEERAQGSRGGRDGPRRGAQHASVPAGGLPPRGATCLLVSLLLEPPTAPIAGRSRVENPTAPPPTAKSRRVATTLSHSLPPSLPPPPAPLPMPHAGRARPVPATRATPAGLPAVPAPQAERRHAGLGARGAGVASRGRHEGDGVRRRRRRRRRRRKKEEARATGPTPWCVRSCRLSDDAGLAAGHLALALCSRRGGPARR